MVIHPATEYPPVSKNVLAMECTGMTAPMGNANCFLKGLEVFSSNGRNVGLAKD
jgi:hypothetical protein